MYLRFLKLDVTQSHWLDGESYSAKLRPSAIDEFKNFVLEKLTENSTDNRVLDAHVVVTQILQDQSHVNYHNFVSADVKLSNTPAEVVFSKCTNEVHQIF